jgi:hypothetical protein
MFTVFDRRASRPTTRHTIRPPLRLEGLEAREVLDGTVVASWANNVLTFTGDYRDNQVILSETSVGIFRLSSNNGTRIVNPQGAVLNSTADFHRGQFFGSFRALLRNGNDTFFVGNDGHNTQLNDILMDDPSGADTLWIANAGGDMRIRNIVCRQATTDVSNDTFLISNLVPGANVNTYVSGNITFGGGGGIDTVVLNPRIVNGSVTLSCGAVAGDSLTLSGRILGALSIGLVARSATQLDNTVTLNGTRVAGLTSISTLGSGTSVLTSTSCGFGGGLTVGAPEGGVNELHLTGGSARYVSVSSRNSHSSVVDLTNLTVNGSVNVACGTVAASERLRFTNTVIAGNCNLVGSPGHDEVEFKTNSVINGALTISASPASAREEEVYTDQLKVYGATFITTGGGDDQVWIGTGGRFYGSFTVNTASSSSAIADDDVVFIWGVTHFTKSVLVTTGPGKDQVWFDPSGGPMWIIGNLTVAVGSSSVGNYVQVGNWNYPLRIDGTQTYIGKWGAGDYLIRNWII